MGDMAEQYFRDGGREWVKANVRYNHINRKGQSYRGLGGEGEQVK